MTSIAQRAPRSAANVKFIKGLVVFHRWVGIALCLFFAMWFLTGVVMMYVPYPFLGDGARIAKGAPIEAGQVTVAPTDALAASGIAAPARMRLLEVNGQATYVLNPPKGPQVMVSASTGQPVPGLDAAAAGAIAGAFSGKAVSGVSPPMDYDQWMVHHRFDRYRPFFKVDLADDAGTSLYVSQRSGEVMQRTTSFERAWNYVGAVLHWIYPTVLRQSWVAWDRTVWWLSLVGVVLTIAGIWLGIVRWRNLARAGRSGISPYRGWLKWHHIGGLAAAAFVFTWMLSGWLSMDHGRLFSTGEMSDAEADAYTGITTAAAAKAVPVAALKGLLPASEVEITALGGTPYVIARGAGQPPRVAAVVQGVAQPPAPAFPDAALFRAVQAAYPGQAVEQPAPIPADDVYANLRSSDGIGTDGVRIAVQAAGDPTVYINPVTGRVIEVMDNSRRAYRWLYFGLHTLDFPFLHSNVVWYPLMLILLAAGFAFSITSVTIGWRRLKQKARVR